MKIASWTAIAASSMLLSPIVASLDDPSKTELGTESRSSDEKLADDMKAISTGDLDKGPTIGGNQNDLQGSPGIVRNDATTLKDGTTRSIENPFRSRSDKRSSSLIKRRVHYYPGALWHEDTDRSLLSLHFSDGSSKSRSSKADARHKKCEDLSDHKTHQSIWNKLLEKICATDHTKTNHPTSHPTTLSTSVAPTRVPTTQPTTPPTTAPTGSPTDGMRCFYGNSTFVTAQCAAAHNVTCCTGNSACQFDRGVICEDSCNAPAACYAPPIGYIVVQKGSCNYARSCRQNKALASLRIGENSCTGNGSGGCTYVGGTDAIVTIGDGSCNAFQGCEGVGREGGNRTVDIGNNACTSGASCLNVGREFEGPIVIEDNACQAIGACAFFGYSAVFNGSNYLSIGRGACGGERFQCSGSPPLPQEECFFGNGSYGLNLPAYATKC